MLLYIIITNLLRKVRLEEKKKVSSEDMVKCKKCGLHVLEQEAIKNGADHFCSKQHAEEYSSH
jgi:uncharacterized protein